MINLFPLSSWLHLALTTFKGSRLFILPTECSREYQPCLTYTPRGRKLASWYTVRWLRACVLIYVVYRLNFWTSWPLSISICRWRTTQRQAFNFVILVKTIWRKCEIMRRKEISWSRKAPEMYSGGGRFESWPRHRLSRLRYSRLSSVTAGKFGIISQIRQRRLLSPSSSIHHSAILTFDFV